MAAVLNNATITNNWMWFYKALCDANNNKAMYPDDPTFTGGGAKGFYLTNLYGFFNGCKHSDTWLSTVSADFGNAELVASVVAKSPLKPGASVPVYSVKVLPGDKSSGSETKWYCATPSEQAMGYTFADARLIIVKEGADYKVSAILDGGVAIEGDYAYRVVILDGSTYSKFPSEIQVGQKVVIAEEAGYLVMNFYAAN